MESPVTFNGLPETIERLEWLAAQDEHDLTVLMNKDPLEYARLLMAMGALIDKACGSLSKLYEMVSALELTSEYSKEKYDIIHVKHEYGADIRILNKETQDEEAFEIKTSVVKAGLKHKSNWNFKLNIGVLTRYREHRQEQDLKSLIGSVYEKQKNGVTCFVARCGTERINCYKMSGAFVALYCVKKLINASSDTINFGSERCPTCHHYHRMQYLQEYGKRLDTLILESGKPFEYRLDYFDSKQWAIILKCVRTTGGCFTV